MRADTHRTVAMIDIGTNSAKMWVARVGTDGNVRPVHFAKATPRIGKAMTVSRADVDATIEVLMKFVREAKTHRAESIFAFSTFALRRAKNASAVVKTIERKTGVRVRILTGREEAWYAYLSAARGLERPKPCTMVIDVGGGSTECVLAESGEVVSARSFAMGALHLTETYLHSDPVLDAEYVALTRRVRSVVSRAVSSLPGLEPSRVDMVVSGGTATTASAMARGRRAGTLRLGELRELESTCLRLSVAERRRIRGLPADRADIILAGLSIVRTFMEAVGKRVVRVNDGGVREGALIHLSRNNFRW
jgi:exopolyphosphatase/guanosine-5'-triphosphate,3'-diphosphate pyrophosphatase